MEIEASAEAELPSLVLRCHWLTGGAGGRAPPPPLKAAERFLGLPKASHSVPLILLIFAQIEWMEVFPGLLQNCRISDTHLSSRHVGTFPVHPHVLQSAPYETAAV